MICGPIDVSVGMVSGTTIPHSGRRHSYGDAVARDRKPSTAICCKHGVMATLLVEERRLLCTSLLVP